MSTDKVKVAVRVRPMNRREYELATKIVVDMKENQTILYHPSSPLDGSGTGTRKQPKTFAFDNCFWSMDEKQSKFAAQDHVFNCLGKDLLEKAYEGYNGCIFAYGQTGSGKSYTMMGTLEDKGKGIIPRLCDAMFEHIAVQKSASTGFKVEVSYMEIYNEKVHDLLDPKGSKQNLKVREHNILGPYVDGLSMLAVSSFEDIDKLMSEGNKSRTVAATNMNNESSRSHAVFNIVLTQILTDLSSGISGEKVSKISLVDLAGSERAQKTGAVGDRLREGSNINKSLTTLGLVISALADQSAERKKKEKFVPYRDSVLTWLLKDNLGGNSKTVMVATISPAADNYEETLSTLRYADRAKRIVNHAVINEDPNARIIRDLRDEVDVLKKQLCDAQNKQAPVLQDRLEESEKLIKEMTKTWEEKLAETERIHHERHEALEKMGVSVQTSGIKVETGKHYLVNLNADPSLNELLVYYLKDHTLVGRPDAPTQQDIQLSGLGIMSEHCVVDIENSDLYITPLEKARTCVNGSIIHQKTRVKQGDRILWGNNHFFRINCPKKLNSPQSNEPEEQIDYNFAQHEYMMKECSGDPIQEAIIGLERQYEEDKQEALEKQRQEYEKQMQMLRNQIMSPGTPSTHFLNMNSFTPTGIGSQGTIHRKYQRWAQEKEKNFKQSLQVLGEEVLKANALVREANVLAQEMGKRTEFQVTLQIPASNLSPNRRRGAFVSEPAILVKRKNRPSQVWSMEKFENKIIDMRELYEEQKSSGKPMMVEDTEPDCDSWDDGPYMKGDPFYESQENHNLIGVANIFLQCLFHDVKLSYHVPIISQQGEIAGKLHLEISKLGGTFLDRYADTSDDTYDDDSPIMANGPMIVRICIKEAKGLPLSLSNFVFCQYTFWGQEESTLVPPLINPDSCDTKNNNDTLTIKFQHSKDFKVYTSEEFIEFCQEGALSLEVWGHRITSTGNSVADITKTVSAKTRSLTDRWSEVMRKIELWAEVHEINHQGEWSPVEVQPKQEVMSAGVYQLQQGHSRRVLVRVKPATDSGTLPLICESLLSVSVGCIYSRSKLQKGLDSYQEEDLQRLRDRWSDALQKRKEYLHEQIQKLINKQDKSEADSDRERALMDQWVCLTEERNAVMVPSPGSGIPGAPADTEPPPYMEKHMPVLFLDLNADDMSTPNAKEGYQAAGINSILPKEHASTFVNLPLIKTYMEKDSICAVASWDASMHDSVHLNRVTSSSDRVYLILKAVVRLSHPAAMELVLRKRICINIYNSLSFTNLTGKLKQKITGTERYYESGITYDVVSNIPKASEDLENMETLAQMAASQNDTNAADGETYIEKYIKGVSAVESILLLDRLRQEVAVKELSAHQGKQLYKTTSTPNIHQSVMSPTQDRQHMRADSIQDLSHDLSLSPTRFGSPAMTKGALSPLGTKVAVKTMSTLVEEQHKREMKPLLRRDTEEEFDDVEYEKHGSKVEDDPHSVGSEEFQDFESYQSQQQPPPQKATSTADGIVHSNTTDSLAEIQNKNFTPSLVSSGYGSQAVSMLTLSSEDSLSIRSMDDNTDGNKEGRGGPKGSPEQTSSDSDPDDSKEDGGVPKENSPEFGEHETSNNSGEINLDGKESIEKSDLSVETVKESFNESCESQVENNESGAEFNVSSASVEAQDGSLSVKEDPNETLDGVKPLDQGKGDQAIETNSPSQDSASVISSERLRKSKEERQRILESLRVTKKDKIENREKLKSDKKNNSERASAINDYVDPYSETAMEELEKLGFDEEEEFVDECGEKGNDEGNSELVIVEDKVKVVKSDPSKNSVNSRTRDLVNDKSYDSPPKREKTPGSAGRQRPVSCFVSPSQDISNLLEESMKRNSLTLHLSDDDMSGGEETLSVCSFGSRADLDRLQEVPIPSWIQIGESVIVSSSKGGPKTGVVHFVGNVEFASGPWVGVALDLPEGKNDGSVNGIRYFKCRSRHGIFVRHDKLILDKKRRGSRKQAKESTKRHSMTSVSGGASQMRSPVSHSSSPNSSLMKPTAASSAKKK